MVGLKIWNIGYPDPGYVEDLKLGTMRIGGVRAGMFAARLACFRTHLDPLEDRHDQHFTSRPKCSVRFEHR